MASNNTPKRLKLWEENNRQCYWCKMDVDFENSTLDHVIPKLRGGTNDPDNVVIACIWCNNLKGSMLPDKFAKMVSRPHGGYGSAWEGI